MLLLAVDDDFTQLERIKAQCEHIAYPSIELVTAESLSGALAILGRQSVDVILSDYKMGDGTGLDLLRFVKALNPLIPVIIMTAYSDTREAVKLLKAGADDYLIKPIETVDIEKMLVRVHEKNLLVREKFLHVPPLKTPAPVGGGIVYGSTDMARVVRLADQCSRSAASVLIRGESGTGKELLARFIHERSPRHDKPFVVANVAAFPDGRAEAELFGNGERGLVAKADGGTLLIKEVGALSAPLQLELLEFLTAERSVGSRTDTQAPNVRVLFTSCEDLAPLVESGRLRKDLYYSINVIDILIPPLRERKEDIALLVEHFVSLANERNTRAVRGASREAMDALMVHPFPGNVRELAMIVERAVVLCSGDYILKRDLPAMDVPLAVTPEPLSEGIDELYETRMGIFERDLVSGALAASPGNKSAAARVLGISERHLRSRLERLEQAGYPVNPELLVRPRRSRRRGSQS